ncbi:SDR family oxidoreductase [Kaarinaea lacus]
MRVLVTGGAGFIGSHVCDVLIANGHHVVVVDNLDGGRMENIEHVLQQPNFSFHQVDIRNVSDLEGCFQNVDWVIHLAGIADIVPSIEVPQDYFSTNVQGTLNVLECARKNNVKRFVYAASSSCYGIPDKYPTAETAEIRPQYPYALTKYMGEELVMHWHKTYQLPAVSLRLFNVYGPRVRTNGAYGAVFGVFLAQKAHGKPFTVVGDGSQTRDFTYVTDVARAFVLVAESDLSGEVMNVGSGDHYSVNHLVELLGGVPTYIPKRPGEPDCTFADIKKITQCLRWEPKVSFEDGVANMVAQLDAWKTAPLWDAASINDATKTWFHYLGENRSDESQLKRMLK